MFKRGNYGEISRGDSAREAAAIAPGKAVLSPSPIPSISRSPVNYVTLGTNAAVQQHTVFLMFNHISS